MMGIPESWKARKTTLGTAERPKLAANSILLGIEDARAISTWLGAYVTLPNSIAAIVERITQKLAAIELPIPNQAAQRGSITYAGQPSPGSRVRSIGELEQEANDHYRATDDGMPMGEEG